MTRKAIHVSQEEKEAKKESCSASSYFPWTNQ